MIYPVILSGSSGTRLWPMSRSLYPKQLLALFGEASLLQETVRRIVDRPGFAPPLIVANEEHRFIIEGHGAYTAVDGERTAMQPGDFVITPSWTWHDHGNETKEPMVWIDGLDIQIVKLLGASFAEGYPDETQPVSRPEGDSFARFGHNLLPVDWRPEVKTSPVFNYPYVRTREALEEIGRAHV